MSANHPVARTADGLAHLNTLVLRKLWTVVIYIDLHKDAGQAHEASSDAEPQAGRNQPPDASNDSDRLDSSDDQSATAEPQDQTPDPTDFQDSYQLISDIGLYDKTLPRSEATREEEGRLTLRFTEVVSEGAYSLYHRLPSGVEFPIFIEVPFTALEDHGDETEEPAAEEWALPTFEADPAMASGDEHLLHHEADHAALEAPDEWWMVPLYGSSALAETESGALAESDQSASGDDLTG